jgi:hypothetical protein
VVEEVAGRNNGVACFRDLAVLERWRSIQHSVSELDLDQHNRHSLMAWDQ